MATLTVQQPAVTGAAITFGPAAGGGDKFLNEGSTKLRIKNGDASPHTVTAVANGACSFGIVNAAHNMAVVVAAGAEAEIGPFDPARFNDATGFVNFTYDAVTSVTVAAVHR